MNFSFGNPSESLKCAYQQFCQQDAEEREHDRQFLTRLQKFESKSVELGTQTHLARQMKNQYEKIMMQQNPLLWAKVQQSIAESSSFKVGKLAERRTKDVAINTYQEISSASDQDSLHDGIWPHSPSPDVAIKEPATKPEDLKQLHQQPQSNKQHHPKLTADGAVNKEYSPRNSEEKSLNKQHSLLLKKEECFNEQVSLKLNGGEDFNGHPPKEAKAEPGNRQQSPKVCKEEILEEQYSQVIKNGDHLFKQYSPPIDFKFSPKCVSSPYATKQADFSFPTAQKKVVENDKSSPELTKEKQEDIAISSSAPIETQSNVQSNAVSPPVAPAVGSKTFRLDSDSESADVI